MWMWDMIVVIVADVMVIVVLNSDRNGRYSSVINGTMYLIIKPISARNEENARSSLHW